jgi:glycolate oxidase iron-sulfur subunit
MELKAYRETVSPVSRTAKRAEAFSRKIKDISEFLVSALGPETHFGPITENVCFHDPCHLRHGQKLVSPQRDLLRRIPGLVLRDVPDDGQCCGSAGIYNITHRERSMKILEAKIAAIDKTAADRVITSNPGCIMQLQYAKTRWNADWQVSHISEVLSVSLESQKAG